MSYNRKMKSPFQIENETEYKEWRKKKLSLYPVKKENLFTKFDNKDLSNIGIDSLKKIIKKYNFASYEFNTKLTDANIQEFCSRLQLKDSISNLLANENDISNITDQSTVKEKKSGVEYIPYTNKQLNWHTDGYYYPITDSVKSFLLHCENPAANGGQNILLDHEIIYIYLRDHNPDFIEILMQNNIMVVGETDVFIQSGGHIRFFLSSGKIRFEIAPKQLKDAGITMSSKVLRLARVVDR